MDSARRCHGSSTQHRSAGIDAYLADLSADKRRALEKLRQAIKAAAPQAVECISYQLPAFRLDGRVLVAFGASANHCAFYPMSPVVLEAHDDALGKYDTSMGCPETQTNPERFTAPQTQDLMPAAASRASRL